MPAPRAQTLENFTALPLRKAPDPARSAPPSHRRPVFTAQNMRNASKSGAFRLTGQPWLPLQPLCNRSATANQLIYIEIMVWLQSYSFLLTHMRMRPHTHAHTRISRARGPQLRNRQRKRNSINMLMVAARLQTGCRCNRSPRPFGMPKIADQFTGTPAGRGQARRKTRPSVQFSEGGANSLLTRINRLKRRIIKNA